MARVPRTLVVVAALFLAVGVYALLPAEHRDVAYALVALLCVSVAFWGLLRQGLPRPAGWLLVLIGFLGWALGDVAHLVEQSVFELTSYPAPSDAVYIASYAVIATGLVIIVRGRGGRRDLPALLDAAILATGAAVVVGVFIIAPIAQDSSLSPLGKLTSSIYPIADVLLLGILARLWTTPGARTTAFKLLSAALAVTLCGDALYSLTVLHSEDATSLLVNDLLWLTGYVLIAGASWSPSVRELAEPLPGREDLSDPMKRMYVLTGGL